ncbi:ABC transporter permease [Candidatus Liberibacter sp.]|uniref:MlaE family ABC transporter permease n=1 Tax=Candidatus Liberibacter sp. TaxID=34022 RepID=UPI0021751D12|nr:ABC transporter permease [Candidatus Liberibacter sp.]
MESEGVSSPDIMLSTLEDGTKLFRLIGSWRTPEVTEIANDILILINYSVSNDSAIVDLSGIGEIDTIGAGFIVRLIERYRGKIQFQGAVQRVEKLISIIPSSLVDNTPNPKISCNIMKRFCSLVGKKVFEILDDFYEQIYILGSVIYAPSELISDRRKFHDFLSSIIKQMYYMGVSGAPVIILISFVVGGVIAQQGAFQLHHFGAEIFAIDLIGILQLREIGVLLTAVMISGRSGSAMTAEIGSMKMNEEIDALKVMGIDFMRVLISPRIWALVFSLPLLTILADFSAVIGASTVVYKYYGIPFSVFFSRFHSTVMLGDIIAGLIKTPFMAFAIGIIASRQGLKVRIDSNSLGSKVTLCVVKSISAVILIDTIFAIFYFSIGI